jgi:hypothetical protein|tara:strand:- start:47080 stop:47190 length:111 start_codon:yes stop_codon:yes gene_type:complete
MDKQTMQEIAQLQNVREVLVQELRPGGLLHQGDKPR